MSDVRHLMGVKIGVQLFVQRARQSCAHTVTGVAHERYGDGGEAFVYSMRGSREVGIGDASFDVWQFEVIDPSQVTVL